LVLAKVQIVDELQQELIVDLELNSDLVLERVPMPFAHGFSAKVLNERQENDPLLDSVHDSDVRVGTLVDLHLLQLFQQLFGLLVHITRVTFDPFGSEEAIERILAFGDVVPKTLHIGDEHLDVVDILDGLVDQLRLTEFD
jgi:hypothetical protein